MFEIAKKNPIVDFTIKLGELIIIQEKYGIVFDTVSKRWMKPLTLEEAQKIINEINAKKDG